MKIQIRLCKHKWVWDWQKHFVELGPMSLHDYALPRLFKNKIYAKYCHIGWINEEYENHEAKVNYLQYGCYRCKNWTEKDFYNNTRPFWPREFNLAKRIIVKNKREKLGNIWACKWEN